MSAPGGRAADRPLDPTLIDPKPARKGWFGRRKHEASPAQPPAQPSAPAPAQPPAPAPVPDDRPTETAPTRPDPALAPPGFHVYRPSSAPRPTTDPPHDEDDDF